MKVIGSFTAKWPPGQVIVKWPPGHVLVKTLERLPNGAAKIEYLVVPENWYERDMTHQEMVDYKVPA